MADTTGKAFWSDASKKVATWLGSTTGAAALGWVLHWLTVQEEGAHRPLVYIGAALAIAFVRAVIALIQGNVGDRSKASWSKAPAPADPDDE